MSYTCRNCGAKSEKAHKLCNEVADEPEANFCGIPEEWICKSNLPAMKYTCETCGSLSLTPENLCKPEEIR